MLHLQNTFRLSWVPDEVRILSFILRKCMFIRRQLKYPIYLLQLVSLCSNNKCRAPFTQVRLPFIVITQQLWNPKLGRRIEMVDRWGWFLNEKNLTKGVFIGTNSEYSEIVKRTTKSSAYRYPRKTDSSPVISGIFGRMGNVCYSAQERYKWRRQRWSWLCRKLNTTATW